MDLKTIRLLSQKRMTITESTAAGFPPYTRGNDASGYLLKLPEITEVIDSELIFYSFTYEDENNWEELIPVIKRIQDDYLKGKIQTPIFVCKIVDDISLEWIALMRAIRVSWSILNQENEKSFIPLQIKVWTPFGYHSSLLKILSAEIDGIISKELTENIMTDFINDFRLMKTIDSFGGSDLIEKQTELYSKKIIQKITS